jgi:4-amino-4-deoxy-L-arabinose transferase-like glycosyltransferase
VLPLRIWGRIRIRKPGADLLLVLLLVTVCGLVHGINFDGWPGRINDDEGTYAAQAYAMQYWHQVAHYTYWYDHPFGGWLLIAAFDTVTGALSYSATAVTAARECMLMVHLATVVLLYTLARRLRIRRSLAVVAVLLFSVSPLSVHFQRLAFLDNIAVLWILASLVCAASSRKTLAAAVGAGTFLAFAFWSKETIAILAPGVFWLLHQNRDLRNWRFARVAFLVPLVGISGLYFLYAALKNELIPGPGHVSLLWALKWQLLDRPSGGSLLNPHSGTYGLARYWLSIDPYLPLAGLAAATVCLFERRMRPVAVLLLLQFVLMMRSGYLPYAYVTAMLPFAALSIAGLAERVWTGGNDSRLRGAGRTGVAAVALVALIALPPVWGPRLHTALTVDASASSLQATRWYLGHLPHDAVVVTDDNIWTDLVRAGCTPYPIWLYKADLDPAVHRRLPHGWRDIDYVILGDLPASTLADLPTVRAAIQHSVVIMTFDSGLMIRRVIR